MRYIPSTRFTVAATDNGFDRRGLIVGAGVVGVAVVAMQALRGRATESPVAVTAKASPAKDTGYRATPHVLRYYETAKS
jgi:hypothetical protein